MTMVSDSVSHRFDLNSVYFTISSADMISVLLERRKI